MKIERDFEVKKSVSTAIGMFSVSRGTIQNLGLENVKINVAGSSTFFVGIGGLVESNRGTVQNCSVGGEFNVKLKTVSCNCGGIAGENFGKIINCYNKADLYILNDGDNQWLEPGQGALVSFGGVTGVNKVNDVKGNGEGIKNVYNVGDISFKQSINYKVPVRIGGIVGWNEAPLDSAYTTGTLACEAGGEKCFVGSSVGICEGDSAEDMRNCYHLPNRIGIIDDGVTNENFGEEKEESYMKSEKFVDLLNEGQDENPWKQDTNNINDGYPILSWQ